ncbi:MAG TPA: DUF4136 domain-containing protein [Xanthomonadaceae bacterium]|nr:DUF4136 domain-containing protein [Xanthomonadaceae bacterium]
MSRFRTLFRSAIVALAALALAACATGPRVSVDADPAADFSAYRSFAFFEPLALESRGYSTLLSERLRDEARRQMEARGFVYEAANPDLRVNLNALVEEKTDVVRVPEVDVAWYWSYRARAYVGVPIWHERVHAVRYREGTVNVDLVDARERRLVWEGIAVGSAAGRTPAERRERAGASVATIFEAFPHRAGGAAAASPPVRP